MPRRCPDGRCRERCHGRYCRAALLVFRPPEEFSLDPQLLQRLSGQIDKISRQLEAVASQLEPDFSLAVHIEPVPTKRTRDDDPEDVLVPVVRPIGLTSPDDSPGVNVTAEARRLLGPV